MDERLYWIWLAETLGQGSPWAPLLVRRYGGAKAVYEGAADDMEPDGEIGKEAAAAIHERLRRRSLERAGEIAARCDNRGIRILTPDGEGYPGILTTLRDMPLVLYVLGEIPGIRDRLAAAIVGTRKMTDYGRRVAYSLGAGLAFGGATVVSGMALGADSMALVGALDAGGSVIAVLGSGVDIVYPQEHREIYQRILSSGAVISEYPPGSPPVGSHFPVRNRIMSGLSDATVVVEAGRGSGALITAKLALAQGRKLFAVPGRIGDEGAEGTNDLIREGALPAVHPEDVLAEFEFLYKSVNLPLAHSRMRNLDFERLSLEAMQRTRIGTQGTGGPRTSGSPGTRAKDVRERAADKADEKFRQAVGEREREKAGEEKPARPVRQKKPKEPEAKAEPVGSPVEAAPKKENSFGKSEKQTVNSAEKVIPARKTELELLDESEWKVYNKMKPSVPTLPDELVDAETPIGSVLSALTVLELAGAVESGSGGYFMRVAPDDIMASENS